MKKQRIKRESPALQLYKAALTLGRLECDDFGSPHLAINDDNSQMHLELTNQPLDTSNWLTTVAKQHCGFDAGPALIDAVLNTLWKQAIEARKIASRQAEEAASAKRRREADAAEQRRRETEEIEDALTVELSAKKS